MSNQSNPFFPDNISLVGKLIIYPYTSTVDFFFFLKLFESQMAVEDFCLLIVKILFFLEGGEIFIIVSCILENGTALRVYS